jgi:hypothetical protein
MGNTCKHGMVEEWCAFCRPIVEEPSKEDKELDNLVKEYVSKCKTFREERILWTSDEISVVYDEFKDKGSFSKKEYKRKIYEVSLVLERTRNAVKWMIKHIFSNAGRELHRGSQVLQFRETVGLV